MEDTIINNKDVDDAQGELDFSDDVVFAPKESKQNKANKNQNIYPFADQGKYV